MLYFRNGDKVEVKKQDAWLPATVIRSAPAARRNGKIYVSYDTVSKDNEENFSSDNSESRVFADLADVRPAQPPERHRYFMVGDEVEVLTGMEMRGWRKGSVKSILENSQYLVAVSGEDDAQEEVDHWNLRAFRVWDDGSWVPPFLHEEHSPELPRKSSGINQRIKGLDYYRVIEGMDVEVVRRKEGGREEVWYPATIMKPLEDQRFLVGYLTLRTEEGSHYVKEEVDILNIRPSPPIIFLGMPVGFEQVDGWYNGGWCVGHVSRVVGDSKYVVTLRNSGEEMAFEHYKLRPHQDWDKEGKWNPAPKISSNQAGTSSSPIKLKIKGLVEKFTAGMVVEIRSDEEGYIGSLFPVKIVNCIGNGEYTVQYQTLRASDGTQPLEEVAPGNRLRPCPPKIEKDDYEVLEEVDAWYHDGWWVGLISRLVGASEYAVYFWTTNEVFKFGRDKLRPHQNWTCGRWTTAPTPKKSSVMLPNRELFVGMMAEAKSDVDGFLGAWFPVKIVSCIHKDKYIVEYETLRTEDNSDFLQETVDRYQIRPRCPAVDKRGGYTLFEQVDAWYNDGWWVGLISQVIGRSEYSVYFWTSSDELKFHPRNLRPHQEWTNGNWITPLQMPNSLMRFKLGKFGKRRGLPASGTGFCKGAIVEVCSRVEGFHDAWYPAVIIMPLGDGKYVLQYKTVARDGEKHPVIQEADGLCIRPIPPVFLQNDPFKALEQVDAWYREGWWVGHIHEVTADSNYLVLLNNTNEVVEFQYEYLRPHQDWLNQKWKSYTKGRTLLRDTEV